jgi:trigger factor
MGHAVDNSIAPPTVVRTDVEPCRAKLDIEVPVERVRKVYNDTEKAFNQHGRVAGFRPGKVPRALLLRQYGSRIDQECRQELIRSCLREVLEKEVARPDGGVRIEDEDKLTLSPDRAFVFSVSFDVAPTFELPAYKGIRVSRQATGVDDAQVNEAIGNWLQRRTSFEKADRASQAGDMVKANWDGTLAEPVELPETSRFYLTGRENWVALRDPELIPGTTVGLAGLRAGEVKELDVTFPANFHEKALAGRNAHYVFTIIEVHGPQTPELTDELAKSAGAESAEQMRERVRDNIKAEQERHQEHSMRQQILTALLAGLDIPLPPARLHQTTYDILMRVYDREIRRGTPQEQLGQRQEELQRQAEQEARHSLKRFYVLRRIAEEEKIEPDNERVNRMIHYMAAANRTAPKVLVRQLQENGRLEDVLVSVREEMVLDRLLALAEVTGNESK